MSAHRLSNKVALVTGGTSGIGLATARCFVEEGAFVFVTGRRPEQLKSALELLGPSAEGLTSDVSSLPDLDRVFDTIRSRKGRLDVLFANAGGGSLAPLGAITEDHFDKTFDTNVRGLVFTVQKALPLMQRGASIILNASTTTVKGTAAFSIYSASKAAVRNLARSWAQDLKGTGIRVNAISPGVIPTPGYDLLGLSIEQVEQFVAVQAQVIPLGRVGTPDEVAKAALFLASDDSSFVNGVELFVDGGMAQV